MEDLKLDVCIRCGEAHPIPEYIGILAMAMHPCYGNQITYRTGRFTFRQLRNVVCRIDPIKPFKELLNLPHLKRMEEYDTATHLERTIYMWARKSDIRSLIRLKKYIELEEEFDSKW